MAPQPNNTKPPPPAVAPRQHGVKGVYYGESIDVIFGSVFEQLLSVDRSATDGYRFASDGYTYRSALIDTTD